MKNRSDVQSYVLPPAKRREIYEKLFVFMQGQQPFLKPKYCIRDLSVSLDIPIYQLSAFFNQVAGRNFNDYINRMRVSYCLDLIKLTEIKRLNMLGLASQCGFHNRNTFSAAFKKYTGHTPASYLRIRSGRIGSLQLVI